MKRKYDFSQAVRGKFFRKGAELNFPISKAAARRHILVGIFESDAGGV
jgi:hypothetical protein